MNCQEFNDFIENRVPLDRLSASFAEAQQHASTCPACAAVLAASLRIEEGLMSLSGVETDKRLTRSVMSRIESLSMNPAVGPSHRDLSSILSMAIGALILAAVYLWIIDVRVLPLSLIENWLVNSGRLSEFRIEILLPTLIGGALIAIGLLSESGDNRHPITVPLND